MKLFVTDRKGEEHTVEATVGESLMLSLRANDLVDATCSGSCSCATCHLFIGEQWISDLPAPSEDEEEVIEFLKFAQEDSRLCCQLIVTEAMEGMKATVAPEEGF
jgi:ferredoxin, 2Fe-2S